MCGIIAAFNTATKNQQPEDANEFIINQYQNQYSRGTEGFGIIRINEKQEIEIDRACEPTKFLIDLYLKKSKIIIAHHRHPTSTSNKINQTHPIVVKNGQLEHDYLVIHNGIISNDEELHNKHIMEGFIYTTECYESTNYYNNTPKLKWNDSEALAIELALFIEERIPTIRLNNTAAFIVLQINKKTKKPEQIFFGKNSTGALNMKKTTGQLLLSSEGEGDEVKENKLYSFKTNDPKQTLSSFPIIFKKEKTKEEEIEEKQKERHKKNTETINLTLEKIKQNQTETTENPTKETLRPYRSWINEITEDTPDYQKLSKPISNTFLMENCKTLKEKLINENTFTISHIIDDSLDNNLNLIINIINEYKEILLTDKLNKEEIQEYSNQIHTILKTMAFTTNIAEKEFEKKEILEEIEDYNSEYNNKYDKNSFYKTKQPAGFKQTYDY